MRVQKDSAIIYEQHSESAAVCASGSSVIACTVLTARLDLSHLCVRLFVPLAASSFMIGFHKVQAADMICACYSPDRGPNQ